ncbi:hypothetical protein OAL32_00330 [Synechococcus sp. AH-551-G15]|nr:hypothetical protein [Synechococcus sp. AH-551-G15]
MFLPLNQTLRYPQEAIEDFIILTASEFTRRGNDRRVKDQARSADARGPSKAQIILPIPDLPNMVSSQKYGALSGALNNALATGLGAAYHTIKEEVSGGTGGRSIDAIKNDLISQANQAGPVIAEVAAGVAGGIVGINSAQFQTLADGQISNPGISLLYAGPSLRSYSMNWSFAPKNAVEAQQVYEIVRTMKQLHLPSGGGPRGERSGGMLKVPHVWDISVYVQGKLADKYQKYFTCALETLSVKQDSNGSHITLPDGSPVISSISTVWKELAITTSEDFEENI